MRVRVLMTGCALLLLGCAGSQTAMAPAPMLEDLAWQAPIPPAVPLNPPAEVDPLPEVPDTARSSAEKVLPYEPGELAHIDVPIGRPLDIVLATGEQLQDIVGGDRAVVVEGQESPPWEVKSGVSGLGAQARPHVYVTATKPGLSIGLILTCSSGRTYYLDLKSVGKSPVRSVRWTYMDTPRVVRKPPPPRLIPDGTQPQVYHVGYVIRASSPTPIWTPRQAVDTGDQTFILLPPTVAAGDAPMLRLIGAPGPEVTNAIMTHNVIILPRLFNVAELRVGQGPTAEVVRIVRTNPRTIQCPGDEACPVWPGDVGRVAHVEGR